MGGSSSKTAISSLSENINNIAMQTVQDCVVTSDQTQTLTSVNTGIRLFGSTQLEQQTEIRAECFSDVNKQIELQNKVINAISQASSSDNVALLGAFGTSKSEATANLTNIVRSNLTMANIQRTYNQTKQTQNLTFSNSGIELGYDVSATQGARLFALSTLKELDKSGIFNQITQYVDQSSKATMQNPLDFIAKAIGAVGFSLSMSLLFFVVLIAAIVLGLGYLGSSGSSAPAAGESYNDGPPGGSPNAAPGAAFGSMGSGLGRMGFGGKLAAMFGFTPKQNAERALASGVPLPGPVKAAANVAAVTG